MGNKQYPEAAKYYHEALDLVLASGNVEKVRSMKVKLGNIYLLWPLNLLGEALYLSGAQSSGVQLFQQVIDEVPDHFAALFAYGKALIEHAELSDAMPVFLKLLVHDSGTPNTPFKTKHWLENKKVREVLADLVKSKEGLEELKRQLGGIPKSASALSFLAIVVKEFGGGSLQCHVLIFSG